MHGFRNWLGLFLFAGGILFGQITLDRKTEAKLDAGLIEMLTTGNIQGYADFVQKEKPGLYRAHVAIKTQEPAAVIQWVEKHGGEITRENGNVTGLLPLYWIRELAWMPSVEAVGLTPSSRLAKRGKPVQQFLLKKEIIDKLDSDLLAVVYSQAYDDPLGKVSALSTHKGQDVMPVLIRYAGSIERIEAAGALVHSVFENTCTADMPLDKIRAVSALPDVIYIETAKKMKPELDVSIDSIRARDVRLPVDQGGMGIDGSGVIVGIVDTGIDFTHADFIDENGETRILFLWDQTQADLSSTDNLTGPSEIRNPYGIEYTADMINDEIDGSEAGLVLQRDTNGHGTHVGGTAAGNMGQTPFAGVAANADIIFVKTNFYQIEDGVQYIFDKAAALNQPCVVNLSLGGDYGPHDGTTQFERTLNNFVASQSGRTIVTAAGNSANDNIHASGFVAQGQTETVEFECQNDVEHLTVEIWYEGAPDSIGIQLEDPNGNLSPMALPGDYVQSANESNLRINARNYQDPNNQDACVTLHLTALFDSVHPVLANGSWRIHLNGNRIVHGSFDMWIHRASEAGIVEFTTHNDINETICCPATAENVMTVASYNTKASSEMGEVSYFSSRGPSRTGSQKPEIAAPGFRICAAFSSDSDDFENGDIVGGQHILLQGTSMAAPHVTGAVALMMQVHPNASFQEYKDMLTGNARADVFTGAVPNAEYGYGKLDVTRIFQNIKPGILITSPSPNQKAITGPFVDPAIAINCKFSVNHQGIPKTQYRTGDFEFYIVPHGDPIGPAYLATGAAVKYSISEVTYIATLSKPPVQLAEGLYDFAVVIPNVDTARVANTVHYTSDEGGNVDIALVLDSSGSMGWNDEQDFRKTAAKYFVTLSNPGDQIAIIDFDSDANVWAPLTEIINQAETSPEKQSLFNAIDLVDDDGGTNLEDGLDSAYAVLNRSAISQQKVAIMLTDGDGDYWDAADFYANMGWPIFTIGLTGYVDEDLLQQIAASTGGEYYKAPDNTTLVSIFNSLKGVVKGEQTILATQSNIQEHQTHQHAVAVDNTIEMVTFSTTWQGSELGLSLIRPDGILVDTTTTDTSITHIKGATFESYVVQRPLSGSWQMIVEAIDIPAGGEDYNVNVSAPSPVKVTEFPIKNQYLTDEPIPLSVSLFEGDQPLAQATVQVDVEIPVPPSPAPANASSRFSSAEYDSIYAEMLRTCPEEAAWMRRSLYKNSPVFSVQNETVILYDDGNHDDGIALDGIYGNSFVNTQQTGTYLFKIQVDGTTSQGDAFTRYVQYSTEVQQGIPPVTADMDTIKQMNTLPGAFSENVEFTISNNAANTVTVMMSATDLEDGSGRRINASQVSLSPSTFTMNPASNNTIEMNVQIPWTAGGNYSGTVMAYNSENSLSIPVKIAAQDVVELYKNEKTGWNLFSLMVEPDSNAIESALRSIEGSYDMVRSFDLAWAGARTYDPALPQFSDLTTIDHAHGYWIHMIQADTLIVSPDAATIPVDTSITIHQGWNLVSYLKDESVPVDTFVQCLNVPCTLIRSFHPQTGAKSYNPQLPQYSDLQWVDPDAAYWVLAGADGQLNLQKSWNTQEQRDWMTTDIAAALNPSTEWVDFYGKIEILNRESEADDLIEAFDSDGQLCGIATVVTPGFYGFLHVYADDPVTPVDEGAVEGDTLKFYCNGNFAGEAVYQKTVMKRKMDLFCQAFSLVERTHAVIPQSLELGQNYPNPFNNHTVITYGVPRDGAVKLTIYDLLGRVVRTLVDQDLKSGCYKTAWDGLNTHNESVASGVYVYQLVHEETVLARKLLFTK